MLDLFAQFATDETAENEGVWVPFGSSEFLVARTGNRAYSRKMKASMKAHQKALDRDDEAADALSAKLMTGVIAETILLGWRTGDAPEVAYKGVPLTYSKEAAAQVLSHKDFRLQVLAWAEEMERFKVVKAEELAKN